MMEEEEMHGEVSFELVGKASREVMLVASLF
jgi:hypothetical protein